MGDEGTLHPRERTTPSTKHGRRKLVALLLGLAVPVGALAWTLHWWTNPDLLERAWLEHFVAAPRPVERATLHTVIAHPPKAGDGDAVLTIRDIRARFARNPADATVTFSICRDAGPFAAVRGSLARHCSAVVPVEDGTRLHYTAESSDHLVMTVSPQQAGRVVVDRVVIEYEVESSLLPRRGTKELDGRIEVLAR